MSLKSRQEIKKGRVIPPFLTAIIQVPLACRGCVVKVLRVWLSYLCHGDVLGRNIEHPVLVLPDCFRLETFGHIIIFLGEPGLFIKCPLINKTLSANVGQLFIAYFFVKEDAEKTTMLVNGWTKKHAKS